MSEPAPRPKLLPYREAWPVLLGILAGILLRLVFSGKPGSPYATMMGSFIYLSPIIVGAVTVYAAEKQHRRTWDYYFRAPFAANVLYVAGTMFANLEGLICAIVIIPLFATLGAVGGLAMGAVCRVTNWPKPTLYTLWALPLLLGALETQVPLPERVRVVEHALVIAAPADRIWQEIHSARNIQPHEVGQAWLFRIGVPLPHAGVSRAEGGERVRAISMGKQVHFEQVVTDWTEQRLVRWRHRYLEDSFPAYAMDEHVVLGGHYFDVTSTAYELVPRGAATELRVRMDYRVSTPFNWYADPVATFLLRNFEEVLLEFYRARSERVS